MISERGAGGGCVNHFYKLINALARRRVRKVKVIFQLEKKTMINPTRGPFERIPKPETHYQCGPLSAYLLSPAEEGKCINLPARLGGPTGPTGQRSGEDDEQIPRSLTREYGGCGILLLIWNREHRKVPGSSE